MTGRPSVLLLTGSIAEGTIKKNPEHLSKTEHSKHTQIAYLTL